MATLLVKSAVKELGGDLAFKEFHLFDRLPVATIDFDS
jgi:hypothetical protein